MTSTFGYHHDKAVEKITIGHKDALEVDLLTYGATISSIRIPCKGGAAIDVVLGFDQLSSYVDHKQCFGLRCKSYFSSFSLS